MKGKSHRWAKILVIYFNIYIYIEMDNKMKLIFYKMDPNGQSIYEGSISISSSEMQI